jgi:hypothetical protein
VCSSPLIIYLCKDAEFTLHETEPRWTKTFFAAEPPANLSFCFRGISTAFFSKSKKFFFAVFKHKTRVREEFYAYAYTVDKFGTTFTLYTARRKIKREGC